MTTDTAAVALLEAALCHTDGIYTGNDFLSAIAERLHEYIKAQGFSIISWNTDMSQAPRDGDVLLYIKDWLGSDLITVAEWDDADGDELRCSWVFPEGYAGHADAWCHLIPPPKVRV